MVRAAITGAFNYTGSDPTNKNWRLRHRLIISELMNQEDKEVLEHVHRHWLGYLAHGNLTEESFDSVKSHATTVLQDIKKSTYPWIQETQDAEQTPENGTIGPEYADLFARYKAMKERVAKEKEGK